MSPSPRKSQRWPELRALAAVQGGYVRARQAADLGFSPQLLSSHVKAGALVRPHRGVYRVAQFPPIDHEELVELWFWSDEEGVFSHETALMLHDLSDALPNRIHLTVPRSWRRRRRSPPPLVVLHYGEVAARDRTWIGLIPVTTPQRTLRDADSSGMSPDLIAQAIRDGAARRLFSRADLRGIATPRLGRPPRHLKPGSGGRGAR